MAPAELEALLLSHAAVADAAVIGVPSEREGELPKAFVVRQVGHEGVSAEEVASFIAEHVSEHKRVRAELVEFVDKVPKSLAGKILRKELRALEASRRAAASAA